MPRRCITDQLVRSTIENRWSGEASWIRAAASRSARVADSMRAIPRRMLFSSVSAARTKPTRGEVPRFDEHVIAGQ